MAADERTEVEIDGTTVSLATVDSVTRTIGFECTSGRWIEHEWTGVPVVDLLDRVGGSPEATHVVVEAGDGHTACVELPAALDGLLAVTRDGTPLNGPRFVSPRIDGPRAVSDVARLDLVRLSPREDPTDHESMELVPD